MSSCIHTIIQEIEELSYDDQIFIQDILTKRLREEKRLQIKEEGKLALQEYQTGNVHKGTAEEIISFLEED